MQIKNFTIPNGLIAAILVIIALNLVFFVVSPQEIVDYVGVNNSYLTVFLIATFGGLSSATAAIFYSAIATFASGGASIWLLGLAGGIGIFIGDSIMFGLLSYGFKSVSKKWEKLIFKASKYIKKIPTWLIYVLLFLILGISPLPNDIVILALVLLGFTYLQIAPVLLLAGISIATLTGYFGESLFSYFF